VRVTLFRDHPAEGWPSMDRCAAAMGGAMVAAARSGWDVRVPMPPAPPWSGTYVQLVNRLVRYPFWARSQRGDVNHILDHSYAHLLYTLDPRRTLVTVHDLAPLRYPSRGWGPSHLSWIIAWRGLRRAEHIIAVSAFTASELQASSGIRTANVYVVPNAVGGSFRPQSEATIKAVRSQYTGLGTHLLLHVGHTQSRKNLPTLVRALSALRARGFDACLLQVGGVPGHDLRAAIEESGLRDRVRFLGAVRDADLIALYSAADVFVFPSLYEGFGLPVLEAMACGTPVVASNAASLPEVVGEAGILVDPGDAQSIADAIARVLSDDGVARDLRAAGLERAKQFTWQRAASAVLGVIETLR
jgi:glycosyltransferase involved in cell wall biosynthesis